MGRKNLNLGFSIIAIVLLSGNMAVNLWVARADLQPGQSTTPEHEPNQQLDMVEDPRIPETVQNPAPTTPPITGVLPNQDFTHPWFGSTAPPAINTGDMRYAVFLPGRDSFSVHRHPGKPLNVPSDIDASTLYQQQLQMQDRLEQLKSQRIIGPPAPGLQSWTSPFLPPAQRLFPRPPLALPLSPDDTGTKQDDNPPAP